MEKYKFRKYATYSIMVVMMGGTVIEITHPRLLPSDPPQTTFLLHGTGYLGSVMGSTVSIAGAVWPSVELQSTPILNKNGDSYYYAPFKTL